MDDGDQLVDRFVGHCELDPDRFRGLGELAFDARRVRLARVITRALRVGHRHAGEVGKLPKLLAQTREAARLDDGLDLFHASRCLSSKKLWSAGTTTAVSTVAVISPPITTIASGRWTSEPGPVANRNGIRASIATVAVIITGRSRSFAPSTTASRIPSPSSRSLRM